MRMVQGDIWAYLDAGYKLVVTTNIGWEDLGPKQGHGATGRLVNNMGAGLAWQAAQRWPELPAWYAGTLMAALPFGPAGLLCIDESYVPPIEHPTLPLIFLPVKPLHPTRGPRWSWDQQADPVLIDRGLERLTWHHGHIALTLPGCGNGGLDPSYVLPLLRRHLREDRFVVVDRQLSACETLPALPTAIAEELDRLAAMNRGRAAIGMAPQVSTGQDPRSLGVTK